MWLTADFTSYTLVLYLAHSLPTMQLNCPQFGQQFRFYVTVSICAVIVFKRKTALNCFPLLCLTKFRDIIICNLIMWNQHCITTAANPSLTG